MLDNIGEREIRAVYDADTITVYQAFHKGIASTAVAHQTFVCPPFKKERMTWIKPSFLWMMYRSGWAIKENQEHILAIKIKRTAFETLLQQSCLSHYVAGFHEDRETWKAQVQETSVRIQWDPEKDLFLDPLPYRSIQIGLRGAAVDAYINDWIVSIEDITERCHYIKQQLDVGAIPSAKALLPMEERYPLPENLARHIHASL